MPIPPFDASGDLPEGIHFATKEEITARFGAGTPQRQLVTANLLRVLQLAENTGKMERFLVYGSYITAKPAPNDTDVFLVMAADFDSADYMGETAALFDHREADRIFGASVFFTPLSAGQAAIDFYLEAWQMKRGGTKRGIVEVQR